MTNSDLSTRSGRILATVVREYIHTGEPVASVVIARRGTLGVSSATVRNVLARLEEQGFESVANVSLLMKETMVRVAEPALVTAVP